MPKPSSQPARRFRRHLTGFLLTCVVVAVSVYAVCRPTKPPPFEVLHRPFKYPVTLRDRTDQFLAKIFSSAWAWRVEQVVFGRRKPVLLDGEIISVADPSRATPSSLALGTPHFSDPDGLQVWLLSTEELKVLTKRLKQMPGTDVLLHPRVSTADAIASVLSSGNSVRLNGSNNEVGITLGCFASVHTDTTDLIAEIRCSELVTNAAVGPGSSSLSNAVSIQTNLDTSLRVQIPKGSGIFLMDGSTASSGRKHLGVLIDLSRPNK